MSEVPGKVGGIAWLAALGISLIAGCATNPPQSPPDSPPGPPPTALRPPGGPPLGAVEAGERALFNGVDLSGWRETEAFMKAGEGRVSVADGCVLLREGSPQTGITWRGEFPRSNYEVRLEASRLGGCDFFCGMTFPVGDEHCTLIVGGWGGMVVGLSNVDGMSAAENLTTLGMRFDANRWYGIRLRVSDAAIRVWIDGEEVIDLDREGRRFDIWPQQEPARPFGINTWYTAAALRGIRLRHIGQNP